MKKPSLATLSVFKAALRSVDENTLVALRARFVLLGEHPAGIAAIDGELAARKHNQSQPVANEPVR